MIFSQVKTINNKFCWLCCVGRSEKPFQLFLCRYVDHDKDNIGPSKASAGERLKRISNGKDTLRRTFLFIITASIIVSLEPCMTLKDYYKEVCIILLMLAPFSDVLMQRLLFHKCLQTDHNRRWRSYG